MQSRSCRRTAHGKREGRLWRPTAHTTGCMEIGPPRPRTYQPRGSVVCTGGAHTAASNTSLPAPSMSPRRSRALPRPERPPAYATLEPRCPWQGAPVPPLPRAAATAAFAASTDGEPRDGMTARSIRTRTPCGRVLTPSKASRARGTQQLRPCGKLAGTDRATRRSGSSNAIGTQPLRPCGKPKGTACVGQTAASGCRDCLLQVQGTGPLCPNMHRSPSGARKAAQYGKRQSPSVSPSSPTAATTLGGVPDPLIPVVCRANCPLRSLVESLRRCRTAVRLLRCSATMPSLMCTGEPSGCERATSPSTSRAVKPLQAARRGWWSDGRSEYDATWSCISRA